MFKRFIFSVFPVFFVSWVTMSLPALAANDYVKSLNLNIQPRDAIQVTIRDDENGDPDDHAISGDITFDADIDIALSYPGALKEFAIQWGSCVYAEVCKLTPVMWSESRSDRDLNTVRTFTFPVESMDFGAGLALDDPHSPLYGACRERGENGSHVTHRAFVTLAVATGSDHGQLDLFEGDTNNTFHLGDYSAMQTFPVDLDIDCTSLPTVSAPPKPKSVDLRVKQIGESCPKQVEVSAFIDYEKKTEARFHFLHNGKPSEEIVIQPRKVTLGGKSWWRVERLQRYKLDPGQHRFRVAVVGGPKSKVETIRVQCEPFRVDSTWLSYKVEKGSACPKRVVETINFTANRPGKITYEIKHQGGLIVHAGTVNVRRDGDHYTAAARRTFETGEFHAELMAQVKNNPAQNSGWTPLKVACLEVLGGKISFRDKGKSCPRGEDVAISFRADQAGGKVRGERCACRANTTKIKIGEDAWQCKMKVAKLSCIDGKTRGRKCVCSRNMRAKRIGAAAYRCVGKPAAKRGCPRGKVRIRGKCVRPEG